MIISKQKENVRGEIMPKTINEEDKTVDVTWSMGGQVRRRDPEYGSYYEEISLAPEHVRLARLENGAPVLNNHNSASLSDQIGVVTRAWLDNGVGGATLKFSQRAEAQAIFRDVSEGIYRNVSVGYKPYKAIEIEQEGDFPILRAVDTEFFEISLVPINAEAGAQVRGEQLSYDLEVISNTKPKISSEEKSMLTRGQADPNVATKEAKNTPPKAEEATLDTRGLNENENTRIISRERQRIRSLESLCSTHKLGPEFTRGLVDNGTSEEDANKLILGELTKRSEANTIVSHSGLPKVESGDFDEIETRRASVKNGLLFGVNPSLVRAEELNENVKAMGRKSIPQIVGMELERGGARISSLSDEEIVRRSFHSTSDFPLVMGLAGEAAIKQSYLNLVKAQTFRPLVRYEVAKNFMPMRKMQMGEIPSLERIPEGAEVSYGTTSENAEQWAIGKYGRAFAATYEMMVNDQKNLIFGAMTTYAAAASNLESNLAWGVFKANPMCARIDANGNSFATNRWFSPEHKNESESSALTHESLEESEYLMSVQKGNDEREGDELNIVPRFLIVPSRLKNTAKRLIYSQYNPTQVQDVNLYQNQFDVISEARLNPKQGEDYPWYMCCDPNVLPVLWMAYLNGEQSPRTMYQTDFDTLSIKIRADLNFGVTHGEWRAVHRNKGVSLDKQRDANQFPVVGTHGGQASEKLRKSR